MNRIYLGFVKEPKGHLYRALLDHALLYCEAGLLVIRKSLPLNDSASRLLFQLDPFLIQETERSEWPGTRLLNGTARVFEFNFTSDSVSILKRTVNSLFAWRQPDFPEDLCLLRRGGEPWLVTVAHEQDGLLNLAQDEMENLFKSLPEIKIMLKITSLTL